VIIVEFLNRLDRYATGYITFFDIKSREVIWATKMKGLPGGKHGPEEYYGNGIVELYVYFFGKYYHHILKEYK